MMYQKFWYNLAHAQTVCSWLSLSLSLQYGPGNMYKPAGTLEHFVNYSISLAMVHTWRRTWLILWWAVSIR